MNEPYKNNRHGLSDHLPFAEPQCYQNYEIGWLDFNWRVLSEAEDPQRHPLLDRIRFLSIAGSNLDEFFQKRIGGLKRQQMADKDVISVDGRTTWEQLQQSRSLVEKMKESMSELWHQELKGLLHEAGYTVVDYKDLNASMIKRAAKFFDKQLFPVLTPLLVDLGHPFPFISNLSLSLAVEMLDPDGKWLFARVKVPLHEGRFIEVGQSSKGVKVLVPVEQIIAAHIESLFSGMKIERVALLRITRDAEGDKDAESADDLLDQISGELRSRKYAPVVRVEISGKVSSNAKRLLIQSLDVVEDDLYIMDDLLGYEDLAEIASLRVRKEFARPRWVPADHARLKGTGSIFSKIRAADLLVHRPYQSFNSSFESFLHEAAHDPRVQAIKMTLYRSTDHWSGFDDLKYAAEQGKQVAVLVELQARFDEARNIEIARELEQAGVHVAYGIIGLKVHAKTTLVVRKEGKNLRNYAHIATGNYNPSTARLYEDFGLYTADPDITEDVVQLFHALTGAAPSAKYKQLWVAPKFLRSNIVSAIQREIAAAKAGKPAYIRAKMNTLEDPPMVQLLYTAAEAGVQIDLIIRGVSRLIPGIQGNENIRVRSIIGQFLEHSRVYNFCADGEDEFYVGSADWMRRNLDHRVEVVYPVLHPKAKDYMRRYLDDLQRDDLQSWVMNKDGSYTAVRDTCEASYSVHEDYKAKF